MQELIYTIKLHEAISMHGLDIIRVPGGWIYSTSFEEDNGNYKTTSCFVPYDNEFNKPL